MPDIIKQLDKPTPEFLSLEGKPGLTFEEDSQMTISDIQAFTGTPPTETLVRSQDLLIGRTSTQIPGAHYFKPASTSPVSIPDGFEGNPYYPALGGSGGAGTYKDLGPRDGRY